MKKVHINKEVFFPVPAALVVSGRDNKFDIITVAWTGIVSSTPPMIEISLNKKRNSCDVIKLTKEFTVNIPSAKNFVEVDYCGLVSGRDKDKFKDINFTPVQGKHIKTPIIKECPFNLECIVKQEIELGDYVMFVAEILEAHLDEDKTDGNNRANVNIGKVDPLIYCATVREYWSIGKKLGNAFDAGKNILKK